MSFVIMKLPPGDLTLCGIFCGVGPISGEWFICIYLVKDPEKRNWFWDAGEKQS